MKRLSSILIALAFFSFPAAAHAIVITLTTTGTNSWTVPADWNSSDNTIETYGAGAGGNAGNASTPGGAGGGGGYSQIEDLALTPSASVTYAVGAGGASSGISNGGSGGDTWFNGASLGASSVGADGGDAGSGISGGSGGSTSNGIGTLKPPPASSI